MRAVACPKNIAGAERLARDIAHTEKEIAYYFERLDIIDETVAQGFDDRPLNRVTFSAAIASLKRRKDRLVRRHQELESRDEKVLVCGEPEAKRMGHGRAPRMPSYNHQSVVDVESGLIVHQTDVCRREAPHHGAQGCEGRSGALDLGLPHPSCRERLRRYGNYAKLKRRPASALAARRIWNGVFSQPGMRESAGSSCAALAARNGSFSARKWPTATISQVSRKGGTRYGRGSDTGAADSEHLPQFPYLQPARLLRRVPHGRAMRRVPVQMHAASRCARICA